MIEKGNPAWRELFEEIVYLDSGFRRNDEGKVSTQIGYVPELAL
jgi:hypothetical protein